MTLYKGFNANLGRWFWSIEAVNDDDIYTEPYEVKIPKRFSLQKTLSGEKMFFRNHCDVAYSLTIADGTREDSPVYLIGGNPVEIVSLQVKGPVE